MGDLSEDDGKIGKSFIEIKKKRRGFRSMDKSPEEEVIKISKFVDENKLKKSEDIKEQSRSEDKFGVIGNQQNTIEDSLNDTSSFRIGATGGTFSTSTQPKPITMLADLLKSSYGSRNFHTGEFSSHHIKGQGSTEAKTDSKPKDSSSRAYDKARDGSSSNLPKVPLLDLSCIIQSREKKSLKPPIIANEKKV